MKRPLAITPLLLAASPAFAQTLYVPVSDTRAINAANGTTVERREPLPFQSFSDSLFVSETDPGGAFSNATVSMDSTVTANRIAVIGSATGNGTFQSPFCAQADATGDMVFEIPAACAFRMHGFVEAYDQAWAWVTLREQGSSADLGGYIGLDFGLIPFDDAGYLQPGTYVLSLSNMGGHCNGQFASMDYDVTLDLTPFAGSDCASTPNSTGLTATLGAEGTPSVAANDLVLQASGAPAGQFSLFLYGQTLGPMPLGNGNLCLADPFIRLGDVEPISASGDRTLPLDLTAHPFDTAQGAVQAGETWRFQLIFRDAVGAGLDLSDELWVTFAP